MAYSIQIDIPPLSEQLLIVEKVIQAEQLILKLEKSSKKLREYKNSRLEVTVESLFDKYL